jgi:CRP-like cAMP-binding protein
MPLDWLGGARRESVGDLIARKKYPQAIDRLRAQMKEAPATSAVRLQLADVLVMAGRGAEAVPILLGLSDDYAADGFNARAMAALRRVEKVDPGRADVAERLAALARGDDRPKLPLRLPSTRSAPLDLVAPAATLASPMPAPRPEPGPEAVAATLTVASRLRGAFRRLLAKGAEDDDAPPSVGKAEPRTDEAAPSDDSPEAPLAPRTEADAGEPDEVSKNGAALFARMISGRPETAPGEDTNPKIILPGESTDQPPAPPARPRAGPGEDFLSMPEAAFQERVDDLIEGLLQPDAPPPRPRGARSPEGPAPDEPPTPEPGLTSLMFDDLSPAERQAVLRGLKLCTFEPGDILVTRGEVESGLCLLTAGAVRVFTRDSEGRSRPLGRLEEGDFFGEISSLAGPTRLVTVVAASSGEMLELAQGSLDRIAEQHPRVWARMHAFARERAASRRARPAERRQTDGFGLPRPEVNPWGPRLRLRMAEAFLRAGQRREAIGVLRDLADELALHGQAEKAAALLKKIDGARAGDEAPESALARAPAGGTTTPNGRPVATADQLPQWISGLAQVTLSEAAPGETVPEVPLSTPDTLGTYRGLRDTPLFDGLSDDELWSFLKDRGLKTHEPGDILLTEGEPGDSVLVVAGGRLKIFVRNRAGRDRALREVGEGTFLGEIATLSGQPRTATVTCITSCAVLRLDKPALEELCRRHPPARKVLEEVRTRRAANPQAPLLRADAKGRD